MAAPEASGSGAATSPDDGDIVAALAQALPDERRGLLAECVRRQVMAVLRLDAAHRPDLDHRLIDLGLDSLMAVQLRNQLATRLGVERRLPATLVFDHPSCRAIAAFLEAELFGAAGSAVGNAGNASPQPQAMGSAAREAVERLSDAETEALLLERLKTLEGDSR